MLGPVRDEEDEPRPNTRPKRNFRRLVPYFKPYRQRVLWTIVLMLVVTAAGLAGPALTGPTLTFPAPVSRPGAGEPARRR
jgi:hypothetical protein